VVRRLEGAVIDVPDSHLRAIGSGDSRDQWARDKRPVGECSGICRVMELRNEGGGDRVM